MTREEISNKKRQERKSFRKISKESGITLISLVITIIVMLILVGVSITLAVNGGLFEYAGNAVGATKNAMENEQGLIDEIIENYINTNVPIAGNDGEMFSPIYTENTTITQGEYTATIPAGFAVGTSEGINKIETGLVIRDKDGNEFVWVPCTTDKTNTSVTQYAKDTKYNDGTTASKQYYYMYNKETKEEYTDWEDNGGNAKSVEKYGGFYVARYEAGIPSDAPFYSNTDGAEYKYEDKEGNSVRNTADYVPVSKKNNPCWNGISQTNAVTVSANMYKDSSSVESSLIDSYAWDTIVNWMESKEEYKGIATNSTNYGNYVDSEITLTEALYSIHQYDYSIWNFSNNATTYVKGTLSITETSTSGKQTVYELATGSTDKTKVLNIYDMAGNMWEWTTETGDHNDGTEDGSYAVVRGGSYAGSGGGSYPISSRYGNTELGALRYHLGFRVVLYIK